VTPSPSETPYQSYYDSLAAQGFLPAPDGSAEANQYAGIVGAVVGLLTIALGGFMISKAYKKNKLMKDAAKQPKRYRPGGGKDEESPFTPYTSEPTTPTQRTSLSITQTPSIIKNPMNHLQPMETYRTSHGPVHVKHASNRRLSVQVTTDNAMHVGRASPSVQSATYYSTLRHPVLPKPQPPRIKSIQFQQQQRMLRLAKEEDLKE
jgi:hypothetical protein